MATIHPLVNPISQNNLVANIPSFPKHDDRHLYIVNCSDTPILGVGAVDVVCGGDGSLHGAGLPRVHLLHRDAQL